MKTLGKILVLICLIVFMRQFYSNFVADYMYEKSYSQLWELADKSSTIPTKQKFIAQFVQKLEEGNARGEFSSNNAVFFKTPNNAFDSNLTALKTLSERLSEIQGMNPTSFEYNTAIQQITAQEQGEAHSMLDIFEGCYILANYSLIWQWIGGTIALIAFIGLCTGTWLWAEDDYL